MIWPSIRGKFTGPATADNLEQLANKLDSEHNLLTSYSANITDGDFETWACEHCRGPVTEEDRLKVIEVFQKAGFSFIEEPVLIPNMFDE